MEGQQSILARLCRDMEAAVGRQMHTPRDFDLLSERIFEKTHQNISATTLKRLYGYLQESVTPRRSSLNLLAQFLDYTDWDDYCYKVGNPASEDTTPDSPTQTKRKRFRIIYMMIALVALVVLSGAAAVFLLPRVLQDTPRQDKYIIHQGDRFATYDDYLKLFGIYDAGEPWAPPLPHHPNIIVWGPEYHHPQWHNEGDTAQMMPTIREYYTPLQDSTEVVGLLTNMLNVERYHTALRFNELRITFMKNLNDTNFVFLGVYRLNKEKSDTTSLLWERLADEIDLNHLNYLEQLRN